MENNIGSRGWGQKKNNYKPQNIMSKHKFCINSCVESLKVIIVFLHNKRYISSYEMYV